MNILFCGSEIKGNFISEISRRKKDNITFTGEEIHIMDFEKCIFSSQYDVIVVDVADLCDETEDIVSYLERVKNAKNSKIIICAIGYSNKSILIQELIKADFKNFILANGLATQNEEYEKCISGYYENNEYELKQTSEEDKKSEKNKYEKAPVTNVGVCGTLGRIGTTTQCLQIIKYIISKGYTAAYIEVNDNQYIKKCSQLYSDVKKSSDDNCVIYKSIPMYTGYQIDEAIRKNYDYLIYDYGNITDTSFNKVSYLEKKIKVMVCGFKANEFESVQPVLQTSAYTEVKFIFSFVPEADKQDLLEMMEERSDDVVFASYAPDPFDYVATDLEKILKIIPVSSNGNKDNRKKIFWRFRKNTA